ncbi:hypothetical protein C8F01DRAFT_1374062 [Mycena amicta]|nr:hypothetical protein C8F01DRAFT_1374062 [Mycena amicta]
MSIATLAPEILQNIFEESLSIQPIPHPLQSPLLLTQICGSWRAIALHTPSLWSSCRFHGSTHQTNRMFGGIKTPELLELWLSRTRVHPLRYDVRVHQNADNAQRIMTVLLQHANQWQDMSLTFPSVVLDLLTGSTYPLLEKLALRNTMRFPQMAAQGSIPAERNPFPRLRHLITAGLAPSQIPLDLPLGQLTRLKCGGWVVNNAVDAVRRCGSLQHFEFFWSVPGSMPSGGMRPPLLSLRALRITNQNLLTVFILPGLVHLHLHNISRAGPDPLGVVAAFVSRSSCAETLESLIIDEGVCSGPTASLHALLSSLPALTHLSLRFDHDHLPGIPIISRLLADTNCLLKLNTLILRVWMDDDPTALPSLLEALKLRFSDPNSHLHKFELTVQARSSSMTPPESPPPDYPERPGGDSEYRTRHRNLIAAPLVEEFRSLADSASVDRQRLQLRLAAARPADGFRGPKGYYVDGDGDVEVFLDTWTEERMRDGGSICRCSFCLGES